MQPESVQPDWVPSPKGAGGVSPLQTDPLVVAILGAEKNLDPKLGHTGASGAQQPDPRLCHE